MLGWSRPPRDIETTAHARDLAFLGCHAKVKSRDAVLQEVSRTQDSRFLDKCHHFSDAVVGHEEVY